MLRILALALALFAAGCLSGSEDPVGTAAAPAADDAAAPAEREAEADAEAEEAAEEPALTQTPIAYSGTTPQGACSPIGCQWQGGAEDFHVLDVAGTPVRLSLSIAYGEQLPGMDFYAAVCRGADESADCGEYVTGPSPLTIEMDLAGFAADAPIGVSLGSVGTSAGAAGLMLFGEASFDVEGVLVTRALS